MASYFAMFSVPAVFALAMPRSKNLLLIMAVFVLYVFLIGYRENIGMDWNNYLAIHSQIQFVDIREILYNTEAASNLLFWVSQKFYSGIYTSNLVAAVILMAGVLFFCNRTSEPWLSLVAATPYVCIVIGMSATRQAMALGVIFVVFALWQEMGLVRKSVLIFFASLFHTSAILIGAFLIQDMRINLVLRLVVGVVVIFAGFYVLSRSSIYSGQLDFYADSYLTTEGQIISPGALAHVALVAVPAILYFVFRDRIYSIFDRSQILDLSALICLALVPAAFVFSTAASRFSIYMQFLPMIVYPVLVEIFDKRDIKVAIRVGVIVLNIGFVYIWLRYANNSFAYLPYKNVWWM